MKILVLLLLSSCAGGLVQDGPGEGKSVYSYVDPGGSFKLVRDKKELQQKLITRSQILDTKGSGSKVLEKSVTLSQLGSIKVRNKRVRIVRPLASEFTVWLEGSRYSSKLRLDEKNKAMRVTLDSPETKWQGTSTVKFPPGKYFCFFNQIPECLYHNYLLTLARQNKKQSYDFFVVWDSYPFVQDQLSRVGTKLFAPSSVKFDGEINGLFRYIVEVEGQIILYQFTKSFDLAKIAWISQGITIAPPGEAIVEDE